MSTRQHIHSWFDQQANSGERAPESFPSELRDIVDVFHGADTPFSKSKDEVWEQLSPKLGYTHVRSHISGKKRARVLPLRPIMISSIAASIILAVAFILLRPQQEKIVTQFAEQATVKLPDQSSVALNAGSSLIYDRDSWEENRKVKLKGEAYFDVSEGSKFVVETELGNVQVLGTTFNVKSRQGWFSVECSTGKVSVSLGKNETYQLTEGEGIEWIKDNGSQVVQRQLAYEAASWREGEQFFDKIPFNLVISELQRQFDVTIKSADFSDKIFTGYFNSNNLEEALKQVCLPMSIDYEFIDDTQIRLREKL